MSCRLGVSMIFALSSNMSHSVDQLLWVPKKNLLFCFKVQCVIKTKITQSKIQIVIDSHYIVNDYIVTVYIV